jgi:phosphodiesterase/alkaline phosphatase D-like protein
LKFFAERKIANPVVLTGDIHSNWANDLLLNFEDLDGRPDEGMRPLEEVFHLD